MLNIGDTVYYARIIPSCGIYDVCELKIRSVYETYFVGVEKRDQQALLFNFTDVGRLIFIDRDEALDIVLEAQENRKPVSGEKYYDEY